MTKPIRRIYTYKNRRDYTYVANLTDKPMYVAYLGRMGYVLPPLTKDSTPTWMLIRPYKGLRKRRRQATQMEADFNEGKIIFGTFELVEEAMTEAKKNLPN